MIMTSCLRQAAKLLAQLNAAVIESAACHQEVTVVVRVRSHALAQRPHAHAHNFVARMLIPNADTATRTHTAHTLPHAQALQTPRHPDTHTPAHSHSHTHTTTHVLPPHTADNRYHAHTTQHPPTPRTHTHTALPVCPSAIVL